MADRHLPRIRPTRRTSFKRTTSGECALCGTFRRTLHRDHRIPRWKGGPNSDDNIQLICANCHEDKNRDDMLGYRHPPEVLRRIAELATGRTQSPETRAKIALALTGRTISPLARERMSAAQRRRYHRGANPS